MDRLDIAEQVICVGNCVVATSCFGGMAFPRRLSHDVQPNDEIRLSWPLSNESDERHVDKFDRCYFRLRCSCCWCFAVFLCHAVVFMLCGNIRSFFRRNLFEKTFKDKGKRTIYSPGMFTTICGYIPIAIGIIVSFFTEEAPTLFAFLLTVVCGMILGALSLNAPEKLLKSKDTLYGFTWGDGYLSKYLDVWLPHCTFCPHYNLWTNTLKWNDYF